MAAVNEIGWSPDSKHLLISLVADPGSYQRDGIEVLNPDGTVVIDQMDISPRGWLDNSHILAFTNVGDPVSSDYGKDGEAVIVGLDGTQTPSDIPYESGPLASGFGPVAIPRFKGWAAPDVPRYDFVVWSDGKLSDPHDGFPFEWSRNEKEPDIAIYHPFEPTRGVDGWLEVVSWPDLKTVYEDEPHEQIGNAYFDPHGDFIAFQKSLPNEHLRIATTWGTKPFDLPADQIGRWFWRDSGIFSAIDNFGTERSWDAVGTLESITQAPAAFAESSADGSTVLYWNGGDVDPVTSVIVERDGIQTTYPMPTTVRYPPGAISPDGTTMALANDNAVFLRNIEPT